MATKKRKSKADPNVMLQAAMRFDSGDLETNENGAMSDRQRNWLKREALGAGITTAVFGGFMLLVTLVFILGLGIEEDIAGLLAIYLIFGAPLFAATIISGRRWQGLWADSRDNRAAAVEGRVEQTILSRAGTMAPPQYEIHIGENRFKVRQDVLMAFQNGNIYRLFYTPRTRQLLSAEIIFAEDPFITPNETDEDELPPLNDGVKQQFRR